MPKKLKFGLYTSRGNATCLGLPGSLGFEALDAQTYADWGVDYLKVDSCGFGSISFRNFELFRDGFNATKRPVWLTICSDCAKDLGPEWGTAEVFSACGNDVAGSGNSWYSERCNMVNTFGLNNTGKCSNGNKKVPAGVLSQVDAQYTLESMNISGPGAWNDMDIMFVCYPEAGGMTWDEQTAHFALWVTLTSPLMLSHDLRLTDDRCRTLVANREVLAVNQDAKASPAFPIHNSAGSDGRPQVFVKPLTYGYAAVMVNRGNSAATVRLDWVDIPGLNAGTRANVRELLGHTDRSDHTGGYTTLELQPHAAELVHIKPLDTGVLV